MVIDASRLIRRLAGCALGLALAWAAPMTAAADRPPPTDPQLADLLSVTGVEGVSALALGVQTLLSSGTVTPVPTQPKRAK